MQKITKAQVLALFLGTASASTLTPATLLNGPSSADRIPTTEARGDDYEQLPTPAMSAEACAGNAGCTADGEKCGYFQVDDRGDAEEHIDICVSALYCNSMGKLNGRKWNLQCWEDVADGATAARPTDVNVAQYFTDVEAFITKKTVTWDDIQNLWVSPRFNMQDGWWEEKDDGLFWETDKPQDNRCFEEDQCAADECCGLWPDQNNRRCMAKALDGVAQLAGPVSFTPTCSVIDEEDVVPENAQEDIAKGALAQAAEALDSYADNLLSDAKLKAGYADMSADEQQAWDEARVAADAARKVVIDELKAAMGYDSDACDDACKEIFDVELLEWKKEVRETCEKGPNSIQCREADQLKKDLETARAGAGDGDKGYYSEMTAEERLAFKENWQNAKESRESAIAAAWRENNAKAEGTEGGSCRSAESDLPSCDEGMCCGYSVPREKPDIVLTSDDMDQIGEALGGLDAGLGDAFNQVNDVMNVASSALSGLSALGGLVEGFTGRTPEPGELQNVCVTSADNVSGTYTDDLDQYYEHTCMATKLMGTAAASLAVVYSLM